MRFKVIVGHLFCLMKLSVWKWLQILMLLTGIVTYNFYTINIIVDEREWIYCACKYA